ncbi:MAG: glycosyltransferase family 25 protein [Flavobacteriales bacterium]
MEVATALRFPTGVSQVFVISKAGDHERKQLIKTSLDAVGIDHEFFDATMGAELDPAELSAITDAEGALHHKTIPRRLHASVIGCFLSHQRVYDEVIRRELSAAIVLEDDAEPVPGRIADFGACISELPADWDLLYLGLRGQRRPPLSFWPKVFLYLPVARLLRPRKYRLSHAEVTRLFMRPFSSRLDRAGYHQGTHAYAISRKGAAILKSHWERINAPADVYLGTLIIEGKLNAFAVRENLFNTSGATTQIVSGL